MRVAHDAQADLELDGILRHLARALLYRDARGDHAAVRRALARRPSRSGRRPIAHEVPGLAAGLLEQAHLADHHVALDGLEHVVDGEPGHRGRREGLHLDPGLAAAAAHGLDRHAAGARPARVRVRGRRGLFARRPLDRRPHELEAHVDARELDGVAHGHELPAALGRHDARHLRHGEHVALLAPARAHELERGRRHPHEARRPRDALGLVLCRDVHHAGASLLVDVREVLSYRHVIPQSRSCRGRSGSRGPCPCGDTPAWRRSRV